MNVDPFGLLFVINHLGVYVSKLEEQVSLLSQKNRALEAELAKSQKKEGDS